MANNPTLRTPESYLDEVAREKGFENWQEDGKIDTFTILEAMRRYKDAACEKQREIDINNTGFIETTSEKLNIEEYSPFITSYDGKVYTINKASILNAPLATEE